MMHPVLTAITDASFTPLGWFEATPEHGVEGFVVLVGNAGSAMYERFAAERDPSRDLMDDWCRDELTPLAENLGAKAVFPFDKPPLPFLRWAQAAKAGFPSRLGMNIHPEYGLWHAFRAALIFPDVLDLPAPGRAEHPCESCIDQPCLSTCPVSAFTADSAGTNYDVDGCASHLLSGNDATCNEDGCLARIACPVGADYKYVSAHMQFHLSAFVRARAKDMTGTSRNV